MAENNAQGLSQAFWGSLEFGRGEVMINLRLVRYARPLQGGTELVFDQGDTIAVTTDFPTVRQRLYAAFDHGAGPDSTAQNDAEDTGGPPPGGH